MSNKYAPRTIQQQQQQQQQRQNSNSLNTYCEICGDQYDKNDRHILICTICGNKTHLNCEQLTNDEYQVLSNIAKHPNIYWKCVNCSWPNTRQITNIENLENLVEMMYSQLKNLNSKVDFLCQNVCKNQQTISSIIHQNHNQDKLLFNQTSPNQHNQFNLNQSPLYSTNQNNYASTTPRWSRYLPASSNTTNLNNLPMNHLDNSYYSSNIETDELRNIDIEHLSSQPNNSHFKSSKPSSHYSNTNKNQSMDLINTKNLINNNKLLLDSRVQNKSQSSETNTQYQDLNSPNTASNIQSLYSPTQMLPNHLTQQQQPQLETLTEPIYDVIIKPADIPNKQYLLCVLSHIESPNEFYVHLTDESTSNPVDDISEQLANCYNNRGGQYPVITENLEDLKNKFFAALYANDDNWYRVRVLDVIDNSKLLIQYIDYGNTETVTIDKLNYLKPELAVIPMQSVKCSLSHIKPIDKNWTVEHNYFFKNISGYDQEKIVTAYITNRPEVIDYDSIIEVFLWNNDVQLDGLKMDNSNDILINSLMVEIGIAVSLDNYEWIEEAEKISKEIDTDLTPTESGIKIVATNSSETATKSNLPQINLLNNTSNQPKDLEINQNLNVTSNTLTPTSAYAGNQSFESECSFDTETLDESRTYTDQILSDNMTLNDNNEPISSILNNESLGKKWGLTTNDNKQKAEKIEEFLTKPLTSLETQCKPYPLDDLVPGSVCFIKITSTRSPSHFYAVLPFSTCSYEKINVDTAHQLMNKLKMAPEFVKYKDLSSKMKLYYSKAGVKDQFKIQPKIGFLVAAKEDQNFFRARIVQVNSDNMNFQLQCVDTGKVSTVNRNNIFKLKPEFYELPEFAVQYSMPNIEPYGNSNLVNNRKAAWSESAKKAFMEFTFGNVFLANILEIVKCEINDRNGTNKNEKVLCELLNIFEEQENVDDYMISKKYAQLVREEERTHKVELSSSLESDKNSLIKDDNNNNQEDKNKENDLNNVNKDNVINGELNESNEKIDDELIINKLENKKDDEQLINGTKNDDKQETVNGKLESDSKQTSIETDYSNE